MRAKVCQSLIQPHEVKVASSSTAATHTVIPSTIWTDGICSCEGFFYRGSCKHLVAVEEESCDFVAPDKWEGDRCPNCNCPIAEFEWGPEWD